jgi:hypothetical protein
MHSLLLMRSVFLLLDQTSELALTPALHLQNGPYSLDTDF